MAEGFLRAQAGDRFEVTSVDVRVAVDPDERVRLVDREERRGTLNWEWDAVARGQRQKLIVRPADPGAVATEQQSQRMLATGLNRIGLCVYVEAVRGRQDARWMQAGVSHDFDQAQPAGAVRWESRVGAQRRDGNAGPMSRLQHRDAGGHLNDPAVDGQGTDHREPVTGPPSPGARRRRGRRRARADQWRHVRAGPWGESIASATGPLLSPDANLVRAGCGVPEQQPFRRHRGRREQPEGQEHTGPRAYGRSEQGRTEVRGREGAVSPGRSGGRDEEQRVAHGTGVGQPDARGCVRADGQGHPHIPIVRHPERDENGSEGGHGFAKQDGPPPDRAQRRRDRQGRTHQAGEDPARARGHELNDEDSQAAAPVLPTDQGRDEREPRIRMDAGD